MSQAERELEARSAALAKNQDAGDAYAAALERFLHLGGGEFEPRARSVCADLGLPVALDRQTVGLSGGERARAALAAILLSQFDLFLLDEPTNDLDFDGLERLERFLDGLDAALVVVSHDRAFLDRTVKRIAEIDPRKHGIREWAGGWSEYEAARDTARSRRQRAYSSETSFRRSLSSRGSFCSSCRRATVQAISSRASRERLGFAARSRWGRSISISSSASALRSPNGSGKSTLLHMLLGELPLASGRRLVGKRTVTGVLEQARTLDDETSLLDLFSERTGLLSEDSRTLLAKFGLGADHVLRKAASLSPGERTRARLAELQARRVNMLVLDEPTNHLDIEAIEQLEIALASYEGALVLVSHDRRFLERVRPTRELALNPGV